MFLSSANNVHEEDIYRESTFKLIYEQENGLEREPLMKGVIVICL